MHTLFLSLSQGLIIILWPFCPPPPLRYRASGESITLLYASCPTWMQITEGSTGKAALIKPRCPTHCSLFMHTRRQDEQQVAHVKRSDVGGYDTQTDEISQILQALSGRRPGLSLGCFVKIKRQFKIMELITESLWEATAPI